MASIHKDDGIRALIADAIAKNVKSYDVPAECARLKIQASVGPDDATEANSSKRSYVKSRLMQRTTAELNALAFLVNEDFSTDELADALSDIKHAEHNISELVRRDVLKVLNQPDDLFGERPVIDVLAAIFGKVVIKDNKFDFVTPAMLVGEIRQHFLNNPDWSAEDLLIQCGALTCSHARFVKLLEEVIHPTTRRDEEQTTLAERIGKALHRAGFTIQVIGSDSGYPIYGVVRLQTSVSGALKNLIFASTGPKPELVFRDAINNDVEITKNAEHVLVYDIPLPPQGALEWKHLRDWWATSHSVGEEEAKAQLYKRLNQSVRSARSPGEYAIFRSYYKLYMPILGDKLPALLPQVFLHYDPYTKRQRGDEQFLARQRMDFLLMLEHGVRIVIEVDGRQHYANEEESGKWVADAQRYAEMASEDRRLRLSGYEVFRFGGAEFSDVAMDTWSVGERSEAMLKSFFDRLLKKYRILQP